MIEIKAPHLVPQNCSPCIFLAGSIEMGAAVDWQKAVVDKLRNTRWTILNPRRDDWDSSWKQSIDNLSFLQQVEWELDGLEQADFALLYLDPATKSPISLLELGLFARTGKLIVVCPDGFWRKGNVDIVCQRYGIQQEANLDRAVDFLIAAGI